MSYVPQKEPETPKVAVKWADVTPDREDIDSWATRLGVTVIFSELLARNDLFKEAPQAEWFVHALAAMLGISALVPLLRIYKKADVIGARSYDLRVNAVFAGFAVALLATIFALVPPIVPYFHLFFGSPIYQLIAVFIIFVIALFGRLIRIADEHNKKVPAL